MDALQQLMLSGLKAKRLTNDSRQVQPGDLFLAYSGESNDGRHYISQAIQNGAAGVLWEAADGAWESDWQIPNLPVAGLREHAGEIASTYYGEPSKHLWMTGITGTNGKTSCSHWIAQTLSLAGRKTAVIGTLGNGFPGALSEAINTTPDPIVLQESLSSYKNQGAAAVAMEVSSHGLAQGRLNGTHFDIAVLTNLTRDHLDYHGSMEAYASAKSQLFQWPELKFAVLNSDDALGIQLEQKLKVQNTPTITYGFERGEVKGSQLQLDELKLRMSVSTPWGTSEVTAPVIGKFNAYNVLAVLSVLLLSDIPLDQATEAITHITAVPGRMQVLGGGSLPRVVVDYAHTPDALAKALENLKAQTQGRLICVFGCGGNRDKGKRPLMGAEASKLADVVIVTSDNPRHENPLQIIADVVTGITGRHEVIADREDAIQQAIALARTGDTVLLAGKGHENYQQIESVKHPFSDIAIAASALEKAKVAA